MKVLIIEDNRTTAELLAEELRLAGHEAEVAAFPLDIIRRMHEGLVPDVILLDFLLPGADGLHLLAMMGREPSWASVPVILMTAMPPSAVPQPVEGIGSRPLYYLSKPFDPETLLASLASLGKGGA